VGESGGEREREREREREEEKGRKEEEEKAGREIVRSEEGMK
jgi:hypothetical protein